jgi:stage II sporulation protein AA (anti-sigma F factor antagonist)
LQFELNDLNDGTTLITPRVRLDALGVSRVEPLLLAAVGAARPRVLIDLAGVDFIASMGIHMLVSAARTAEAHGGYVTLFGAQPMVAKILDQTALGRVMNIVRDRAAALMPPVHERG